MAILVFALIVLSLYIRIAKFDAHNFTIAAGISIFTFLTLGVGVLVADYAIARHILSLVIDSLPQFASSVDISWTSCIFAAGYEIVALFILLTVMRFGLGFSHTVSLFVGGAILIIANIYAIIAITGNTAFLLGTQSGVWFFWLSLTFILALAIAVLGPVLVTANIVVLVAIYVYNINAISEIARYLRLENLVGVIGMDTIVLMVILTTALSSVDTAKSLFERR